MSECSKCHGKGHVNCSNCGGNGSCSGQPVEIPCWNCNGSGWANAGNEQASIGTMICRKCDGTGKLIESGWGKCPECDGKGYVTCPRCNGSGIE